MRAAGHRHDRRGAGLLLAVLVAAPLWATACGSDDETHPRRTSTPVAGAKTPTATPAASEASRAGPPHTVDAVVEALDGRHIDVERRTVRLDRATLTCAGSGSPARGHGAEPQWTRFTCIQPTFPKGAVAGPDLLFVVESAPPHRLVVTRRYLSKY